MHIDNTRERLAARSGAGNMRLSADEDRKALPVDPLEWAGGPVVPLAVAGHTSAPPGWYSLREAVSNPSEAAGPWAEGWGAVDLALRHHSRKLRATEFCG